MTATDTASTASRPPVLYLSHGAPPLADDATWTAELAAWSDDLPRPSSILVVSAHWELAPTAVSATTRRRAPALRLLGLPAALLRGDLRRAGRARAGRGRWPGCSPAPARRCTRTRPAGSTTAPTCR